MWPGDVNVMHRKRVRRIWGIWKKSVSWVFASEEDGWLSGLAEVLRRVPHVVWGRWKSQHRKIVYLPPHVEKTFNLKVIKSVVPELRSRVFVFRESYVIYIWVMNILCTFHISVSWVCYAPAQKKPSIFLLHYFSNHVTLPIFYCPFSRSTSPTRRSLTQGQKPEGRLKWG